MSTTTTGPVVFTTTVNDTAGGELLVPPVEPQWMTIQNVIVTDQKDRNDDEGVLLSYTTLYGVELYTFTRFPCEYLDDNPGEEFIGDVELPDGSLIHLIEHVDVGDEIETLTAAVTALAEATA